MARNLFCGLCYQNITINNINFLNLYTNNIQTIILLIILLCLDIYSEDF